MSAYIEACLASKNPLAQALGKLMAFSCCRIRLRQARLFMVLVASVVAIAAFGFHAARQSLQALGEGEAAAISTEWVQQLVDQLPDIDSLAQGRNPTETEFRIIKLMEQFGNVYRFNIFSPDGTRTLASGLNFGMQSRKESWSLSNADAKLAAKTRKLTIDSYVDSGLEGHPSRFTRVLSPVVRDGKTAAVLEVYIDDTKRLLFLQKYAVAIAVVTGLFAVLAFSLPGLALYRHAVKAAEVSDNLKYLASHDAMTGLMNRATFDSNMTDVMKTATPLRPAGLIRIDLDKFKLINDCHGHDIGDRVLIETAQRLNKTVGEHEIVARIGGDEFAVIVKSLNSRLQLGRIGRNIVKALAQPVQIGDLNLPMGGSVGLTMIPADATNLEDAMKRSDVALYRAKELGRTRAVFFREKLNEDYERRRAMEFDLKKALANNEFELHYQPIVDCTSRQIKSFEALLRWNSPQRGMVPPLDFIPLAEEAGLIEDIGEWVVRTAISDACQWPESVHVSVNVSPHQMRSFRIYDTVKDALKKSGLEGKRLAIEVTESAVLEDADRALEILDKLHSLGVCLAIDDFGTGYSSLTYLHKFPFDNVKIDRTFIKSFFEDNSSKEIVRAVVDLGANLGKHTIAEGVETEIQAEALLQMNCASMQGFLISRPVNFRATLELLTCQNTEALEKIVKESRLETAEVKDSDGDDTEIRELAVASA